MSVKLVGERSILFGFSESRSLTIVYIKTDGILSIKSYREGYFLVPGGLATLHQRGFGGCPRW